jgi:hypothetical protein
MSNHIHLVIETPSPTLVAVMAWMVFHLRRSCDSKHLNLARAKLIGGQKKLEPYAWSSYDGSLKAPKKRPEWLKTVRLQSADCTQTQIRSHSDAKEVAARLPGGNWRSLPNAVFKNQNMSI